MLVNFKNLSTYGFSEHIAKNACHLPPCINAEATLSCEIKNGEIGIYLK